MSSLSPATTVPAWDERSRQRKGSGFTTCLLPDLLLAIGIFFLRVPNVALRKERGGICPVATHRKCAHRECETLSDACPRVGGYICFLIGGVGRMRRARERESESGEILSCGEENKDEFGEALSPLSRYTLVHRSDKPAPAKNTRIPVINQQLSCIPELSHQIIRSHNPGRHMVPPLLVTCFPRSATGSVSSSQQPTTSAHVTTHACELFGTARQEGDRWTA